MSALDDAIARHAAYPAASGCDPLSNALSDQALADLSANQPPVRAGWENEPIEVPIPRLLGIAAFLLGLLSFLLLGGCASTLPPGFQAEEPAPAHVMAACPPLTDMRRSDDDALSLRVAELERWYAQCRDASTRGKPAKAPQLGLQLLKKGAP